MAVLILQKVGGCGGYVVGGCRGYVVGGCREYVTVAKHDIKAYIY